MQPQQNVTLHQLLDHLENGQRIHEKFDISWYNSNQSRNKESRFLNFGTSGCAIGEMPALDSRFRFNMNYSLVFNEEPVNSKLISQYFGISNSETWHLFYPHSQNIGLFGGKYLEDNATIEEVIDNLKEFLAKQKNII